jgi:hypothetical protein
MKVKLSILMLINETLSLSILLKLVNHHLLLQVKDQHTLVSLLGLEYNNDLKLHDQMMMVRIRIHHRLQNKMGQTKQAKFTK